MRTARVVLAGLVVLVLATACGSSDGLTGAERSFCAQYPPLVLEAHNTLFGDDAVSDVFLSSYFELMAAGDTAELTRLFREQYSDTYSQACRAAYDDR